MQHTMDCAINTMFGSPQRVRFGLHCRPAAQAGRRGQAGAWGGVLQLDSAAWRAAGGGVPPPLGGVALASVDGGCVPPPLLILLGCRFPLLLFCSWRSARPARSFCLQSLPAAHGCAARAATAAPCACAKRRAATRRLVAAGTRCGQRASQHSNTCVPACPPACALPGGLRC